MQGRPVDLRVVKHDTLMHHSQRREKTNNGKERKYGEVYKFC